jgi:sigma-E factor negative regulatory protein RseB
LAGISVFIETLGNYFNRKLGLSSRGAIHVYSKMKGDYLVTVVGEVPPRTVMQVADSVRYKGQ